MVPPAIGKLIVLAIGTSMWIWMQAYVKVQIGLHGSAILIPKNRTEPKEFSNGTYGNHEYAELGKIKIHYVKKGCDDNKDRIILLLHGFLDFWFIWNRQIPALADEFCVVAPDLRGYGNTTRPEDTAEYLMKHLIEDLKNLIEYIDPNRTREVVLVGHDWGAMISFCFATLHEELINKMIIINGMHPVAFRKQLFTSIRQMKMSWYMFPFRHPTVPEQYLILDDFTFFDQIHKVFTEDEEYAHKYMFSQKGALTGALNYYRAFNNDSEQLQKLPYRKINKTTLILWGEQDEYLTTRVARNNREWLKTSTMVYYPKAGHWLLRECASDVTNHIRKFAQKMEMVTLGCGEEETPGEKCVSSTKPSRNPINKLLPSFLSEFPLFKSTSE